jgi:DNA-binding HxlR family transcriptional regulator
LADRLRELDEAAIVTRNDRGYILTAAGADLLGRLLPLDDWASPLGAFADCVCSSVR